MQLDFAVLILIILVTLYMCIIEIFTIMFRFTGLNEEKAQFQVISMLSGCGFTTKESELILVSRFRRRIAKVNIITGYMFSVAIASSIMNIMLSLSKSNERGYKTTVIIFLSAATFFIMFLKLPIVRTSFDNLVKKITGRFFAKKVDNPIYVLDRYGDEIIGEIFITKLPEILVDKTVIQAEIREVFHISVLTVSRGGAQKAIIAGVDKLKVGDRVVVFGEFGQISKLFGSVLKND